MLSVIVQTWDQVITRLYQVSLYEGLGAINTTVLEGSHGYDSALPCWSPQYAYQYLQYSHFHVEIAPGVPQLKQLSLLLKTFSAFL